VDTVIFDLGGVLMANGSPRDFVRHLGPDQQAQADAALRAMMGPLHEDTDHPWHRLERGEITLEEARAGQHELFAALGMEAPSLGSSSRADFRFRLNEPVLALVVELRSAGLTTGILTNNVSVARPLWWDLHPWEELFDDIVDSHEVGMRKPNPAIFHLALGRLGATAERTAFCDDLPANVDAATALGFHGVLVDEDPTPAIATVRQLARLA
jgi:putative hydrolase of the HAD superfamily